MAHEEQETFAVGHLALGYIAGKSTARLLNAKVNIPFLFAASIISDVDLLIPGLEHRGPTHSAVAFLIAAIPLILAWRKHGIPYVAALFSHSFLGDYLASPNGRQGVQLFFPFSLNWFSASSETVYFTYSHLELMLFAALLMIMVIAKDVKWLVEPHSSNLLTAIPLSAALIPVFVPFHIHVPAELIVPHLILSALFAVSILVDLKHIMFNFRRREPIRSRA